ncbi:MAG: hypothetical protein Kow0022_07280 [Phycisphaerales bacterium]
MQSKTMWMAAGVGVVVVGGGIAAGILMPRLGADGSTARRERSAAAHLDGQAGDSGAADEASSDALGPERFAAVRDEALAALQAELEPAEPYTGRTDEQRLADAWAWVRANRPPDRPYNEVEARMLALMDVVFDGEARSAQWLMNASLIEVEMLRALDADGDGQVTDAEMTMFVEENLQALGGIEHPYIKAKLDTDGDGQLSPQEMAALDKIIGPESAFKGVLERAQLEKWDTDRDGFVSDSERADGMASASVAMREQWVKQIQAMEEAGAFEGDDGARRRAQMQEQIDAQLAQSTTENANFAAMMVAQELMEAMRLETMDQQKYMEEVMASMPPPPDYQAFDLDGDGAHSPDELEAFQRAMQEYQAAAQKEAARSAVEFMRRQFEQATAESDANSDGRLTPDEWDARLEMLIAQRDQRLFLRSYDLDGDGRVGQNELMNFVEWHKAGSLRADANFDGVVDARDLERAMSIYQRQNNP